MADADSNNSRYEPEGEIARGGMGVVLRVKDIDLDRPLAMKRMADAPDATGGGSESDRFARFMEEAQVTAQLDHPAIVPVHDLGFDDDGTGWYTMKLVEGRELGQIFDLARGGADDWNIARAVRVLVQVCQALAYAHGKGVIHRDLKPANIMVGEFGEVYVMDWGLAKVEGSEVTTPRAISGGDGIAGGSMVTLDGSVMGTPEFMPPEQARGEMDAVDQQSDVYSVGAMLYQLLSGKPPFLGEAREVVKAVAAGPPDPLPKDAPTELAAICRKAMAREKPERYADATALERELTRYLEGRVVRAHESGAWAEFKKLVGRNKGIAAALAGVFAALVALVLFQMSANQRIAGALENELAARDEAESSLGKMAVARGLTASRDLDYAKAAFWFGQAIDLTSDEDERETQAVRARIANSRNAPPLRALKMPSTTDGESVSRMDFDDSGRFIIVSQLRAPDYVFQLVDVDAERLFTHPDGGDTFGGLAVCPATSRIALSRESHPTQVDLFQPGNNEAITSIDIGGDLPATALCFSPDGGRLFIGTNIGKIYDFEQGALLDTTYSHPEPKRIGYAHFDERGELLVTVTNRSTIEGQLYAGMRIFDTASASGEPLFPAKPHWFFENIANPQFFDFDGEQIVYHVSEAGRMATIEARTGEILRDHLAPADQFSADGRLAISVFGIRRVGGEAIFAETLGPGRFGRISGTAIATKPLFREISVDGGETLRPLGLDRSEVERIAVSPDGQMVAGWETSGMLRVWNRQSIDWMFTTAVKGSVTFSPDGRFIAGAGRPVLDGYPAWTELQVYESEGGVHTGPQMELDAHLCDAAFSPDGKEIATALHDKTVQFWNWDKGERTKVSQPLPNTPLCIRYSGDGGWLAAVCRNGDLVSIERETGAVQLLVEHPDHRDSVEEPYSLKRLKFSDNGRWLVLWSVCKGVTIWDCELRTRSASPPLPDAHIDALDIHGDQITFALREDNYTVHDWHMAEERYTMEPSRVIQGHYSRLQRRDPGGDVLLSHRYRGHAELGTPTPDGSLRWGKFPNLPYSMSFYVPDTPWIVGLSTLPPGTFSMIDARDGSTLAAPLHDTKSAYLHPALSSDGRHLAALDETWSNVIRVFDLNDLHPTDKQSSLPPDASLCLAEINAGGFNDGGEWKAFSNEEWLTRWQQFRRDHPDWHQLP